MKKTILCFLVLIPVMAVFAAGRPAAAPADLSKPAALVLWTHEDPARTNLEKNFIKEFNEKNPNVTVDYQTYPSQRIAELLTVAFSANQGPTIFNQSQGVIRQFVLEGRTAALDPSWIGERRVADVVNRYLAGTLEAVQLNGELHGLPLEYTNQCLYINKKIFREAGLNPETDYPKTWDDIMALSEKLTIRNGEIITRRGFDFRYPDYTVAILPIAVQLGGQLVSDDGKKAVIGDEAWLAFFEYMRQWGPRGKNLGSPTYTSARTVFDLNDNQIAMSMSGLYQQSRMRNSNPAFYNSGDWMIVPYPQAKNGKVTAASFIGAHFYLVNTQVSQEDKVWGWRFVDYMLSHAEDYMREVQLIQPTQKLFDSAFFKSIPYSDVFYQDLQKGKLSYYGPRSAAVNDRMREAVEAVMLQGVDARTVLTNFRSAVQEILDQQ
jgi:multiple sugar transport system substrate-binding protein